MLRISLYGLLFLFCLTENVTAQRVVYSEPLSNRNSTQLDFIGRSGENYWVTRTQNRRTSPKGSPDAQVQSFAFLNRQLETVSEQDAQLVPGTARQWLITGNNSLDQLMIVPSGGQMLIYLYHYDTAATALRPRMLSILPGHIPPSRFLLVRSPDHTKILLLGFEMEETENMTLHAMLFNEQWDLTYQKTISNAPLTQPFIQEDETSFPAENFDNFPLKLTNEGECLMVYKSCISRNHALLRISPDGNQYQFCEIPVSGIYRNEDIAVSLNDETLQIGFLSSYRGSTLKNVQACSYRISEGKFEFDTSYRFNTTARDIKNKNLFHERFISVPGAGFMLLKEYGKPFSFSSPSMPPMNPWETAYMLTNYAESPGEVKPGYAWQAGLSPLPLIRNPGDLSIFYFPGNSGDSVWSAALQAEQKAEENNPELSYLMIPANQKLYIFYNSLDGFTDPLATGTALNLKGRSADDPIVFWKVNRRLNFQQAHRISAGEIAVPYQQNNLHGFALIRL